jgi:hypothetical protein
LAPGELVGVPKDAPALESTRACELLEGVS